MTVNPYISQQEVLAKFRATLPDFLEVFEGSVPDGEAIPLDANGKIKPHLVVNWAGLTNPPKRVNGIQGAREDSFLQGFSTHAIAGDDDAARQVHSMGWDAILGFEPLHCGEVSPAFFAGVGLISTLSQPTRFSAVQSYRYLINP
jgi:hypothetical protein